MNSRASDRPFLAIGLATVAYFLLGIAGLKLAVPPGYASPMFPAAGLALALTLHFGKAILPSIFLGSLAINAVTTISTSQLSGTTVIAIAGIAVGAVVQAGIGSWLIRWKTGLEWTRLERGRDVWGFMYLGGAVACLTSATVGVSMLYLTGRIDGQAFGYSWWNWWLGDTFGVLIAAPLTLMVLRPTDEIWRQRRLSVGLPILLALAVFVSVFLGISKWEREDLQDALAGHGKDLAGKLQYRVNAHAESIAALRRLIEVSPDTSFERFEYFTRITLADNKDLSALSFNPYVSAGQRRNYERSESERLRDPAFRVTQRNSEGSRVPATDRDYYVPVRYIAPLDANRGAVGFDISSEVIREVAIQLALKTGKPAVTSPIQLVQDAKRQTAVLILHPAYDRRFFTHEDADKVKVIGFAVGVLKIDEFVQLASWDFEPVGFLFRLDDTAPGLADAKLYSSAGMKRERAEYEWETLIYVGDHVWKLTVQPSTSFLSMHRTWLAGTVGLSGLLLAGLIHILLLISTGRTSLVQRIVDEKTTELRIKSDALEQVLDEHGHLLRRIPVGVYKFHMLTDGGYRFDYVSQNWCEQLGLDRDVVLNDPQVVFKSIYPDDFQCYIDSQNKARDEMATHHWEGRFLRKGELIWLQISSTPTLLSNGDIVWEGVQADITQRKLAEEKSRLLVTAVEQSSSSVVITDTNARIVLVNDAFENNTGYQRSEVLGKNPRLLQSGMTPKEVYQQLWNTVLSGQTWHGELCNRKMTGELFWEMATISPVTNDDEVTHYIAIKENITERKHQELELKLAKEEAESANLAKSQFLATMSHEIRTPMNGILGMAQLLLMPGVTEAERYEYVTTILNSGNTLHSLLNDILDLSKVEAGKLELHPAVFHPDSALRESAALFTGPALQKNISIKVGWHGDEQSVYLADGTRIRQMLSNLVSNAIKFTESGFISIDGSELEGNDNEAVLVFSVTDTGLGIPADKIERLFKAFSQIDASSTRQYGGTGLGLSIVKRLAEAMKGSVGVESEAGHGSRFWFQIRVPRGIPDVYRV